MNTKSTSFQPRLALAFALAASIGAAGCGSDAGGQTAPPETLTDRIAPLVEEPDLYKRDGDILYVQNPSTGMNIVDLADPARPRLLGRADVPGGRAGQLFLLQNNVVAVLLDFATAACKSIPGLSAKGWVAGTELALIDATSRSAPTILGRHCIPGDLVAARTVDQVLYMVTSNADGVEGGSRAISLRLNDPKAPAVGAQVDFPGDGKQILVTPTALVVASVSPFNPTDTRVQFFSTAIDGNLLVRGFIDVPGEPMGRFHMDLAGNYFRIVTFERNKSNSRLTILDVTDPDHMKEAGSLPQIGSGQLYATRFDGDRAYVITFRRTDPLYIISLKDPTRPEILGQLEIPDWSDFLFPRGDRLIGVGRGGGGSFVGLTLFDVSDPTRPRGIQQIQINTRSVSTSEATLDYRGLTIVDDGADPYIALPWSTVTFKTDDKTRTLCTVESWLQVVDIGALGFTMQLPTEDRVLVRRAELMARLAVMLGGRVAEELVFGDVSTGAQDDLERASQLARQMVCIYGMSERLGPLSYGRRESMFLGEGLLGRPSQASEATAEAIDAEVAALVADAHATARRLLSERRKGLTDLAQSLESHETLEGDKLREVLEAAKVRDAERAPVAVIGETLVA